MTKFLFHFDQLMRTAMQLTYRPRSFVWSYSLDAGETETEDVFIIFNSSAKLHFSFLLSFFFFCIIMSELEAKVGLH